MEALLSRVAVGAALLAGVVLGGACTQHKGVPMAMWSWNDSEDPLTIAGNIHFVGTRDMGVFLVTTKAGHILIDSAFEASLPLIKANVEKLGHRFEDVRVLLASHAHVDHVQGHARVRELTGARVVASAADARVIRGGGQGDPLYDKSYRWRPCPVDRVVSDGDQVEVGGTVLTAHLTPGHTSGATTWTMEVDEGGRRLAVVFFPSGNVNSGTRLLKNPTYPGIADDYQRSFAFWKSLRPDVFLGSHTTFYGHRAKVQRHRAGGVNPFVDPEGWRSLVTAQEKRFVALREAER